MTAEGKADAHELLRPEVTFGSRPSNDFATWQSRGEVSCRAACAAGPGPETGHAAVRYKSEQHIRYSSSRGSVHPDDSASKLSAAPRAPKKTLRLTVTGGMPPPPTTVSIQTFSSDACKFAGCSPRAAPVNHSPAREPKFKPHHYQLSSATELFQQLTDSSVELAVATQITFAHGSFDR